MNLKLVLPETKDAWFWLKVRLQESTQNNNPIGILNLDQLTQQISESNLPISNKKQTVRYFIQKDNQWVGVISLKDINWNLGFCEIGYLIDEKFHSQGIATEAVSQIINIAFNVGGLSKITATTIVENVPSYRVLEKNGFQKEGLFKQKYLVKNKLCDVYTWGILNEIKFK